MSITKALAVFALLGSSLALPDKARHHHARASSCTPVAGGSSSIDDVPAITSAIASCGKGGTIVIPSGTTYNLKSTLDFAGCVDCDFQLEGTLKFSSSTSTWKGQTAMINIKNIDGLRFRSVTGSGVIDGNGQDAYAFLSFFFLFNSHPSPLISHVDGTFSQQTAPTPAQPSSTSPAAPTSRSQTSAKKTHPTSSTPSRETPRRRNSSI